MVAEASPVCRATVNDIGDDNDDDDGDREDDDELAANVAQCNCPRMAPGSSPGEPSGELKNAGSAELETT